MIRVTSEKSLYETPTKHRPGSSEEDFEIEVNSSPQQHLIATPSSQVWNEIVPAVRGPVGCGPSKRQ